MRFVGEFTRIPRKKLTAAPHAGNSIWPRVDGENATELIGCCKGKNLPIGKSFRGMGRLPSNLEDDDLVDRVGSESRLAGYSIKAVVVQVKRDTDWKSCPLRPHDRR